MLVREYPEADEAALSAQRRCAAAPDDGSRLDDEWFVREDGRGGLAVLPHAVAKDLVNERSLQLLFRGGEVGAAAGDWLFFVGLWTPRDFREEFLAWYRFEHLPILLECSGWSGCRFMEQRVADGCQFHAMHQLVDRAALDSPQRKLSRSTSWFIRLSARAWFDGAFTRRLFKRLPP